ncbi:TDT family transporter [Rothia uropygialis]|uniref:TDT family transporter n=1 Tax=Kocuria sp. 36 TaxID=1415402 RepID=UPI00101DCC98|nr:TDT family transporter [Kocuria sp. 36]
MLLSAQQKDIEGRHGPRTTRQSHAIVPAGPAWFGAVMGTSLFANLTQIHGVPGVPIALFVAGWVLLAMLSIGFVLRCIRAPRAFKESLTKHSEVTAWGMVSMGYLSVGSSTPAVLSSWMPGLTSFAWSVDWVMWTIGTVIGLIAAVGFAAKLMKGHSESPLPAWGLPVVAPMVTATTGAQLVSHSHSLVGAVFTGVLSGGSFFVALSMGLAIFAIAYAHTWRREPLPLAAAASAFIPLGIVGQSTAAAQSLSSAAQPLLQPDAVDALARLARIYGIVVLIIGIPVFLWAAFTTYRGFARGMPFTPGWWAMTFPVGTCSLGTHLMGWDALSAVLLMVLAAHWCVAATGTVMDLVRGLSTEMLARR